MTTPTPTLDGRASLRIGGFSSVPEGLAYAGEGGTGVNFYSIKGELAEALPYRVLAEQAAALARRLLGRGFARGERIGVVAETDGDFLRLFFAAQLAHLIPVPLPLPQAFGGKGGYAAHVRGMIESSGACAVFGPAALVPMLSGAVAGLNLRLCGTLAVLEDCGDTHPLTPVSETDIAYIQFSSGSTRFPLGVAVTHRALLANARVIAQHGLAIRSGDRCVSWLPFFHDMGLVGFMLTPMLSQMSVDLLATRDFARRPLQWLNLISANKGSLSYSPSFGYDLCARRAQSLDLSTLDLSSWRAAGIGGDMVRGNTLRRFADTFARSGFRAEAFVPSYGLAEATLAISFAPLDRGLEVDRVDIEALEATGIAKPAAAGTEVRTREFALCGPVLPEHEAEIRGPSGERLGERHVGQIFIRGPSLMREYFEREEETRQVLSPEGWLDTGDLGYWLGDTLVITGRRKDLILINGRNIAPQDLEWAVESEVGGVRSGDVAAFSVDDGEAERLVLVVETRLRDTEERAALRIAIQGAVRARAGLEAEIVLVPAHSLPHTSSGKLSRRRTRDLFLQGAFAQTGETAHVTAEAE